MEVSALGIFWRYLDCKVEGGLEGGVLIVAQDSILILELHAAGCMGCLDAYWLL